MLKCSLFLSLSLEQVWGVQDSIGMVPGQDPDLRAPALRATCLREISIQLQPQTAGSKSSSSFLVRELHQGTVLLLEGTLRPN